MGHDVLLVCLFDGSATLPFRGKIVKLDRSLKTRLIDVSGWRQLAGVIRDFDPDVVQANAGDTLKFAVLSKLVFRWRTPIVFRNANKVSDFITSRLKWVFNGWLVQQLSYVISVSELCKLDFQKTYNYSSEKITAIPIGIDCRADPAPLPADIEPLFKNGKILLNVASFVAEKNHTGLLTMMGRLVNDSPELKLILIGDGKLRKPLEDQVKALGLDHHVFLLGYRNDVMEIMAHAEMLVLPSKIEGLPGVILEAMCSGTPVIAYDVGGISEVVQTGKTGWLIPAGDEDAFVRGVKEILSLKDISPIKQNAKNLVMNMYNNQAIAERFLEVYKKVSIQL